MDTLQYARSVQRPRRIVRKCAIGVFAVYLLVTALLAVVLYDPGLSAARPHHRVAGRSWVQAALAWHQAPPWIGCGRLAATYSCALVAASLLMAGYRAAKTVAAVYASVTLLVFADDSSSYALLVCKSPIVLNPPSAVGPTGILCRWEWEWALYLFVAYGPHLLFPLARFGRGDSTGGVTECRSS